MKLWFIVGCLLAIPSYAGNSGDETAEELIRAMRADELIAQLVERSVRSQCEFKRCEVDLNVCLTNLDRTEIISTLVRIARRELTPAEMKAAIAYFQSEVGSRHLEVIRASKNIGEGSLNDQKPDTRAAMLAFLDTPAGYRLVTRGMLTNSEEANWLVLRNAGRVLELCRPAQ